MGNLSDRNAAITIVPTPQSPDRAGMIQQWCGTPANIPDNWFAADGSSLIRAEYLDLFNNIGTRYGDGDSPGTTFALPLGVWTSAQIKLALTGLTDSFVPDYAFGYVYNDVFDNWYLHLTLRVDGGLVTSTSMTLDITGVDLFNPVGPKTDQAIAVSSFNGQSITDMVGYADTGVPTTGRIEMGGEGSHNAFAAEGTLMLVGRPTDTLVSGDGAFATIDDAWNTIPIVKLFNDSSSVAISQP